jgi:hypothetical protein
MLCWSIADPLEPLQRCVALTLRVQGLRVGAVARPRHAVPAPTRCVCVHAGKTVEVLALILLHPPPPRVLIAPPPGVASVPATHEQAGGLKRSHSTMTAQDTPYDADAAVCFRLHIAQ